jgi:hypothetical protein
MIVHTVLNGDSCAELVSDVDSSAPKQEKLQESTSKESILNIHKAYLI